MSIPLSEQSTRVNLIQKKSTTTNASVNDDNVNDTTLSKRKQLLQTRPSDSIQRQVDALRLGLVKKSRFGIGRPSKTAANTRKQYEEERSAPNIKLPSLMFFAGAKTPSSFPPETLPEAAFVGRSNVGKSSLLNALARFTKPARVSEKPGLTQQINFFTAGNSFHLIDMPGYGFAFAKEEEIETWQTTIDTYLATRQSLKRVYVLIDARHGLKRNDKEFIEKLDRYKVKYKVVLTKCDLVLRHILARRCQLVVNELSSMGLHYAITEPIMVSSKMGPGIDVLRRDILHAVHANHLLPKPEVKLITKETRKLEGRTAKTNVY
ncbi:P-loop containing nucleoside triphosphate hydrolase protein [Syncephalis plumigaleata]|nr:P-loop containing nucleoside triphosphate hydrolase protein [Syncephalis plumigaleata]